MEWQRVGHDWAAELTEAILFFTASDFTSITSHTHNWKLFSLWLCLFILSGVISPLFSSSLLGTYWPGEFIFQCHMFCLAYCSWGSQGKNTEVFAVPFSRGPCFVRTLHYDPSVLGDPTQGHSFIELDKAVVHVISLINFIWLWLKDLCAFQSMIERSLCTKTFQIHWAQDFRDERKCFSSGLLGTVIKEALTYLPLSSRINTFWLWGKQYYIVATIMRNIPQVQESTLTSQNVVLQLILQMNIQQAIS